METNFCRFSIQKANWMQFLLTESEALALSDNLHYSCLYTLGCLDLSVATDHKPRLGIFNNWDLDSIDNPRIQSLNKSTLPWRSDIIHFPGKWTRGPDALSRYPGKISYSLTVIREYPVEFDSSTCSPVENVPEISSILATNEMGCLTVQLSLIISIRIFPKLQSLTFQLSAIKQRLAISDSSGRFVTDFPNIIILLYLINALSSHVLCKK